MTPLVILLIIPLLLVLDIQDDDIPENYTFYTNVCIMDKCNIHIYFVSSWEDYPHEKCQKETTKGCSAWGSLRGDYIYLRPELYTDRFGFSVFEHEALHILCQCNFHFTDELTEFLESLEYPFESVLLNQEEIRKYENGFF